MPHDDSWVVQSWSPSSKPLTVWHHGNIYVTRCNTAYVMLDHDPNIPSNRSDLWQKSLLCGEVVQNYIGKSLPSSTSEPDRNGWVVQLWVNDDGIFELQKNLPYDENTHQFDKSKHTSWYQETYSILSVKATRRRG